MIAVINRVRYAHASGCGRLHRVAQELSLWFQGQSYGQGKLGWGRPSQSLRSRKELKRACKDM